MAREPEKLTFRDRLRQIGAAFTFARQRDPLIALWLLGAALVPLVLILGVAALTGWWLYLTPFAILLALIAAMLVFNRRITKATYAEIADKPGAAAMLLQNMRGNWRVAPAAAFTPQQDMVHRVVGRPGIILVIEGSQQRLKNMLAQEKRRINRVAPDTPIYEIVVGEGEGQVALMKLQTHLVKLPRNLTPSQLGALDDRLTALAGTAPPIPKGPMPKGARAPKLKQRR
jgi:hypothetical protein